MHKALVAASAATLICTSAATAAPTGDIYAITPALSSAGGAAATVDFEEALFDGVSQTIGTDVASAEISVIETETPAAAGTIDLAISLSSSNGELFPDGFDVEGEPATVGGVFLGANAGGSPLEFGNPVVVNSASFSAFDASGAPLAEGVDILAVLPDFTAGPGGTWTGSFDLLLGPDTVGLGVQTFTLDINVTEIPEPASLGLLGMAGLGLVLRRRA
ncbi:MAG: PEP-CTERM sorting domain-containing protein [Planctomycetota bacterium]